MHQTIALVCAALMFLALARMPIGYYNLLRLVATAGAVLLILHRKEAGLDIWNVLLGATALVFNPLIPVYLGDRALWVPLNVGAGILFLVTAFRTGKD